jgi:hypothetical protein
MSLTPEALYSQLGSLVAEMPDLAHGPITPEMNRWMGRAIALVEAIADRADVLTLRVACQNLDSVIRAVNAQTIASIVYSALAKAELIAPAAAQGAFIAAGHTFDAFAAVGKVVATAKKDVLMVDPYADEKVLTDYAILAPEKITVRILADQADHKKSLKPAAERWVQQIGSARPLSVRLAPAKALHDRLIVVDGNTAWTLGQSFNKLAERAHTSLVRMDPESGGSRSQHLKCCGALRHRCRCPAAPWPPDPMRRLVFAAQARPIAPPRPRIARWEPRRLHRGDDACTRTLNRHDGRARQRGARERDNRARGCRPRADRGRDVADHRGRTAGAGGSRQVVMRVAQPNNCPLSGKPDIEPTSPNDRV